MVNVALLIGLDACRDPLKPIYNAGILMDVLGEEGTVDSIKSRIITRLDHWPTINHSWFRMADYLPQLETLVECESFQHRKRAALLAAKVQFYLGEYDDALRYVLLAEELFELTPKACPADIGAQDELFINRMIEEAIDQYKALPLSSRNEKHPKLTALINRIFDRNLRSSETAYDVVALALSLKRLDVMHKVLSDSQDSELLIKAIDLAMCNTERAFTNKALAMLVELMLACPKPDYVRLCQALIRLDRAHHVGDLLTKLTGREESDKLLAYQIAFEVYSTASQQFISTIVKQLQGTDDDITDDKKSDSDDDVNGMDVESTVKPPKADAKKPVPVATTPDKPATADASKPVDKKPVEGAALDKKKSQSKEAMGSADDGDAAAIEELSKSSDDETSKLLKILSGQESTSHHLQFLIKSNKTDMLVLKNCKDAVRSSIAHNATVMSNGLMHFGTTCDDFLRNNLDWVSKATNWNKFNAVASLGVIHRGHESDARKLLEPYLPQGEGATDSFGFKEGGALYALGLIHANHGNEDTIRYLRSKLTALGAPDQGVNIKHGAALGVGIAALGTHDSDTYIALREALYTDDAVVGEAAAMAMGMVMAGSLDGSVFNEMMQYVVDTQHDKIKRGLRIGISLLMYNRREEAEPFIQQMQERESESALRQTVVWSLAMAYAGTGIASVVSRLLSKVANDPNDDVKRFATTAIGFVMLNSPEECVEYANLLVDHFNGSIRYGAAMMVAIACAGTANKEALTCIEPLLSAKESYVRQGAVIATSMIMIEHNEQSCPKMKDHREKLQKMIGDKAEENISKFGAIVAHGILDAGGRNVTISLRSAGKANSTDLCATVGMLCFQQYWYWHSMVPMISLAFKPTCTIALNGDLKMPKMQFQCNAKPSVFAHVPPIEEKKDKQAEKVETVQLSISSKKARRTLSTAAEPGKDGKELSPSDKEKEKEKDKPATSTAAEPMETDEPKKPVEEPSTFMTDNPSRVVPWQNGVMAMPVDSPYDPLKPVTCGGFIMLRKKDPKWKAEELVVMSVAGGSRAAETATTGEIRTPPPPFVINLNSYK